MNHEGWRRLTEWPLLILSAVFLIVYGYEVIGNLPERRAALPDRLMTLIWGVFLFDYAVNLVLARSRRRWFLTHLWELAIVALPVLRPLRLLRLLSVIAILQRSTALAVRGRVAPSGTATTTR